VAQDRTSKAAVMPWQSVREQLRARGLRWTPQRRVLIDVLSGATGHVTGSELIERCRAVDPETVPSTVYRTLAVLEELGLVSHSHGHDGREEFHVLPEIDHGHLHCTRCGLTWELSADEAAAFIDGIQQARGFTVQVSHLSVGGLCPGCRVAAAGVPPVSPRRGAHPAH
jgi:Fur family ferric uptake transcriptional regulator